MIRKAFTLSIILLYIGTGLVRQVDSLHDREDAIRYVRDNLMARKNEFTIIVDKDTLKQLLEDDDFLNAAALIDDKFTSADADYLKATVISWTARWSMLGSNRARLHFMADYRTTAEQELLLDGYLADVLASLDIGDASDFDKIKAIHDYIINVAAYDQSLTRYSAYDIFAENSAVCLGYAAAAYRLFTDAGIECRIIAGTAGEEEHVWNIVKLEGKWYNIDLTWDDPLTGSGEAIISYDFFLKNAEDFSCHTRAAEYSTEEFLKSHRLTETSYVTALN